MKRKSIVPLLAIAFIVAVISTGIFYGLFVGTLKSAPTAATPNQQVVMTGRALPAGAILKAEDLKLTPWAGIKPPAGAFQKIDDAVGKSVITSVAENELLTASLVGSKSGLTTDSGSLLAFPMECVLSHCRSRTRQASLPC